MKLKTSQWFYVLVVAAFTTAIGAIQWYDYESTGGKIATIVGGAASLFSLYKVATGSNRESNEMPK